MCSLKTDTYDSKTQNGNHQVTISLMLRIYVYNLNKRLAVERMHVLLFSNQAKL